MQLLEALKVPGIKTPTKARQLQFVGAVRERLPIRRQNRSSLKAVKRGPWRRIKIGG